MDDISLVIKIPTELYSLIQNKLDFNGDLKQKDIKTLMIAIDDGIQLPKGYSDLITIPKGATNGKVIETVTGEEFSRGASVYNHDLMIGEGEDYMAFNIDWWNSKFKSKNNESDE